MKLDAEKCNIEEVNFKFYDLPIRPIYRQN